MRDLLRSLTAITVLLMLAAPPAATGGPDIVATFSIVARDPQTGDLGVAVQSRYFAVGEVVPFARADIGALATQALGNLLYGPQGLSLLARGEAAERVVATLTEADPLRAQRQVGVVDTEGRAATYTGSECLPWAGGRTGDGYAVQGNLLAGPQVVDAMAAAYEGTDGDFATRLLGALAAGQAAGGDARGRQSAAILVVRAGSGYQGLTDRYVDLHVEDHPRPIHELRRLVNIRLGQLEGYRAGRLLAQAEAADTAARRIELLGLAQAAIDDAVVLSPQDDANWWLKARIHLASGQTGDAAVAGRRALLLNASWARLPEATRGALGLSDETLEALRADPAFDRLWRAVAARPPAL